MCNCVIVLPQDVVVLWSLCSQKLISGVVVVLYWLYVVTLSCCIGCKFKVVTLSAKVAMNYNKIKMTFRCGGGYFT